MQKQLFSAINGHQWEKKMCRESFDQFQEIIKNKNTKINTNKKRK